MSFDMSQLQRTTLVTPASFTTGGNSTGVDVSEYIGTILVAFTIDNTGGDSNETMNIHLESSDALAGTYADISGAVLTEVEDDSSVQYLEVDTRSCGAFIRAVTAGAGTTPVYSIGAVIAGYKNTQ